LDREIGWSEMQDFRLRYYSTQRDRKEGWMQLILRGMASRAPGQHEVANPGGPANGGVIRMDSILPGFDDIVRQAHDAARRHGLAIDATTATNLSSLDLGTGDTGQANTNAKSPS
jgi:hypothetical protein